MITHTVNMSWTCRYTARTLQYFFQLNRRNSPSVQSLFTSAVVCQPRGTARSRIPSQQNDLAEEGPSSEKCETELPPAGYDYFTKYTRSLKPGYEARMVSSKDGLKVVEEVKQSLDLSRIKPALPRASQTLIPYVNESETLSNLVKLGVDLSKVEKDRVAANFLLKADFERDLQPYFVFLHKLGVEDKNLGSIVTKHPSLFQENLDDVRVRINYLASKKFDKDAIAMIVTRMPSVLSVPTKKLDAQLGFLQQNFSLLGDEVRQVITRYPKLAVWNKQKIEDLILTMDKFLGFSRMEMKQILVAVPKVFVSDRHALTKRFDYIHNTLGFPHSLIVAWPAALRQRTDILKHRHAFLQHLKRDQYDPKKENYVSLKALSTGRDVEFCENVAKESVQKYNEFLKTL